MTRKKKDPVEQVRDYRETFGTEAGKRVLYDLMTVSNMLSPSFVAGDPCLTAYNEGGRQQVLRILNILGTSPERLKLMMHEGDSE